MPLLLLFVAVPIIEIALFIKVGGWIGLWPTLAIVVATAIIGTLLLRHQGTAVLRQLQESLDRGTNPVDPIAHGALILVAAVLLLTPGFFTDTVGFLLLVPSLRRAAIRWGAAQIAARGTVTFTSTSSRTGSRAGVSGELLDGEYTVIDEDSPRS